MRYDISQQTPPGAPYQTGVVYKTNGELTSDICAVCWHSAEATHEIIRTRRYFTDCAGRVFEVVA